MESENIEQLDKDVEKLNLENVKIAVQEVKSYGFENTSIPIFQWRLSDIWAKRDPDHFFTLQSDEFVLNHYNYVGQLTLTYSNRQWSLSLHLDRFQEDATASEKFQSVPFFVCKCVHFDQDKIDFKKDEKKDGESERCFLSSNAFCPKLGKQALDFLCEVGPNITVIGIYQEPETVVRYVSPYGNAVVGKIDGFSTERDRLARNQLLVVSPRFRFGEQLMMVRFWYANMEARLKDKGLSATLHFLHPGQPFGRSFSFLATFTIFSHKKHTVHLEKKLLLRRDANQHSYPVFLAFYRELEPYLDKDTLYYKLVLQSFNC